MKKIGFFLFVSFLFTLTSCSKDNETPWMNETAKYVTFENHLDCQIDINIKNSGCVHLMFAHQVLNIETRFMGNGPYILGKEYTVYIKPDPNSFKGYHLFTTGTVGALNFVMPK